MLVGERIRDRRKAMHISLTQLAKEAGASQGYLSDLENGKVESPTTRILASVADVLKTTVDYLLGRTDDPSPLPATPLSDEDAWTEERRQHTIADIRAAGGTDSDVKTVMDFLNSIAAMRGVYKK